MLEYEAIFNSTCGVEMEYAISETINEPNSQYLVWQTSKNFNVILGKTYNLHARERLRITETKSIIVTV